MKVKYTVKLLITCILQCEGLSWWRQPDHKPCILQCEGLSWWRQPDHKPLELFNNPIGVSKYVALPSVAGDLPRAMDILPGHTLIRPDIDSLRSALKFPKKDLDGARVYGNMKHVGISVGSNERVVNTGFRRSCSCHDGIEKAYEDFESKEHVPQKEINIPVRRKYIILADYVPAEKAVKLDGGSSEENEMNTNESSKESVNTRDSYEYDAPVFKEWSRPLRSQKQSLQDNRKVLRNRIQPIPEPVSFNPAYRKEYHAPSQRLVDYLNSRDLFDHVKISDHAPTLKELVPISPTEESNIRKWWFFNQEDYKPLLN